MPLVNRPDCDNILDKLTDAGVLGVLTGLPRNRQRIEFLSRSRKQLLVALKEATSGKGFDIILRNEFESLAGHDAKLAYTITSLAYMHGAPVRRRHLVASLGGTDVQKARILNEDRREVIVGWGGGEEFFCPRHRVIAKQIATETADRQMRRVAVVTLLSRIRGDIYPESIRRRAPEYVAYRGIVNFDNLLDLFGEQADVIRAIYSELQDAYREDCLFWLQRGRSELYFDNFEFAENYLNASLSIRSEGNFQAYHHLGVLYLKRAATQEESSVAYEDLKAGEDILVVQIKERGREDAYPYAALVTYKLRFLQKKGSNSLNADLEQLKRIAEDGLRRHPYENAMKEAHEEILRAYLMLAVK